MRVGLYAAVSGLEQAQQRQYAIAYNLANSGTPGFKGKKVIAESFRATLDRGQPRTHYVRSREEIDFSQGTIQMTDRNLDVALHGPGFFTVRTDEGLRYTRNGSFGVDASGRLVTSAGHLVLGTGEQPLQVADSHRLSIDEAGQITVDGQPRGQLQVVDFEEPYPLEPVGQSLYRATDEAQERPARALVKHQALEGSNAEPIEALVAMIENLRAFEANQKALQTIDRTLQRAVSSPSN